MLSKVIKKFNGKTYTNANGKECKSSMYFLVLENGNRIAIKPIFSDDYNKLDVISEIEK